MIKLKNILAENMRRFGTKNLNETFSGDVSNSLTKSNVNWLSKTLVSLEFRGKSGSHNKGLIELLYSEDLFSAEQARQIAKQENADFPNVGDLEFLNKYKTSGYTVGEVWCDAQIGSLEVQNFEDPVINVYSNKDRTDTTEIKAKLILLRSPERLNKLNYM